MLLYYASESDTSLHEAVFQESKLACHALSSNRIDYLMQLPSKYKVLASQIACLTWAELVCIPGPILALI